MPRGTSLSRFFCAFPEPAPSDSNRVHLLYQLFLTSIYLNVQNKSDLILGRFLCIS